MKKIILTISLLCAFLFLPNLSNAMSNSFTQMVHQATTPNTSCQVSDPTFCACFTQAVVDGCKTQPIHPNCSDAHSLWTIAQQQGAAAICTRYPPKGVSYSECVTDVGYWIGNDGGTPPKLNCPV